MTPGRGIWPGGNSPILGPCARTSPPPLELPDDTRCIWNRVKAPGEAGLEILRVADKTSADVIIMPADNHRGLGRALHASSTAQVLADASCVVMMIPAAS